MLHCLAIGMTKSADRKRSLEQEMTRVNLPFTWIEGVDGSLLDDPDFYQQILSEFPEYLPAHREAIQIKLGEVGCYLSFIRAFRYIVSHDLPHALIVEDDVELKFDHPKIIEQIADVDLSWDLIKLAYTDYPLAKGIYTANRTLDQRRFNLLLFRRGIIGTTCALYSQAGVMKLLKHCPRYGLSLPIDALIARHCYRMDVAVLFVRPHLAIENHRHMSTIIDQRNNQNGFDRYLTRQGFSQRKVRQFQNIYQDLKHPLTSLKAFLPKILWPIHIIKYLTYMRKKPSPLTHHLLLGSSVFSANVHMFRQLGVRIPYLDILLIPIDILLGVFYWLVHPSQYSVVGWWLNLAKRRLSFRSFAPKPGESSAVKIYYLLRQAGYYGRWWRHMNFYPPKAVIMWNGWRTRWARTAITDPKVKTWYLENAPLPSCLTVDPQGVNAESYVPQHPDFYRAWAKANPEPKIHWTTALERLEQRPMARGVLSSNLALIDKLPKKYIFIPLQKQDDSQIYLHAGWVNGVDDFIRLIYSCCSTLPDDWSVIIKTHPSDRDIEPDVVFQSRPKNVFNGGEFDSIELLKSCSAVVNINGSMGLQSYLYHKPSIVLGNSFYGFGGMATCCNNIDQLRDALLQIDHLEFDDELRGHFLNWLLNHYYLNVPDELTRGIITGKLKNYQIDDQTLESFCQRLTDKWDPWAGLGDDPQRWRALARDN